MNNKFKKFKKVFSRKNIQDIEFFNEEFIDQEKIAEQKGNDFKNLNNKKLNNKYGFFNNFKRRNTLQIIKYLETNKIFNCFFYTNVNNLQLILEQGIRPISAIKLFNDEEYTVWSFLQHNNYLEVELGNSTRTFFWKWCAENKVNLNKLVIISLDINKLFQCTNKEWDLNLENNRLQIYEVIPVGAIDWILIRDKKNFNIAKAYLEKQNLKIKLFKGEDKQLVKKEANSA